jgi:nitroreductase
MEFWDVVKSRHSVRHFSSDPVTRETIERVMQAAILAPSPNNEQPSHFIVASGQTREELGRIIAQTTIHLTEYLEMLGPEHYESVLEWYSSLGGAPWLIAITAPRSDIELDEIHRLLSVGVSLEAILLACVAEGLAACPITFSYWVEDEMATLLDLPDDRFVASVVAVGNPGALPPEYPEKNTDIVLWLD